MDSTVIQQIKEALIDLTEGMKEPDTSRMLSSMERLDALREEAEGRVHPRLIHFLEQRSYMKALQFLSVDEDAAAGGCR